jgi:hypothetical protein
MGRIIGRPSRRARALLLLAAHSLLTLRGAPAFQYQPITMPVRCEWWIMLRDASCRLPKI